MIQRNLSVLAVAAAALALAPPPSHACSVPTFVAGKGLPYHTYLVAHPATLLIYSDPARSLEGGADGALYERLQAAGHSITVVHDRETLRSALGRDRYDLVIAPFGANGEVAGEVTTDAPGTALLPVVEKSQRNASALHGRFDHYVVDGASLGTYLRAIDRTLAKHRP